MKNSGDKSDYEQLHDELRQLQKENAWLKSLLEEHGIPFLTSYINPCKHNNDGGVPLKMGTTMQ